MKRNRYYWIKCTCQQCGREFESSRKDARFCNDNGGKCKAKYHREEKKMLVKLGSMINQLSEVEQFVKKYGNIPNNHAVYLRTVMLQAKQILDHNQHQLSMISVSGVFSDEAQAETL